MVGTLVVRLVAVGSGCSTGAILMNAMGEGRLIAVLVGGSTVGSTRRASRGASDTSLVGCAGVIMTVLLLSD